MIAQTLRRRALLAGLPALLLPAAGLWAAEPALPATQLRVVVSFSVLADLVREVAGELAEVTSLVGPEADPHTYSPRPADLLRVRQADLVVLNGLGFEGWMHRLIPAAGYRGPVLTLTDGLQPRRLGRGHDPHVWHNLAHAQHFVERIRAALAALRPAQSAALDARAATYRAQLAALDAQARRWFDAVPRERRRVLVPHDAFGYLGEAYGLDFVSPLGASTDVDASARDVAALIRLVREQRVQALFFENVGDRRLLERIAEETGARIGGTLYTDALSAPGGPADSYLRLATHNLRSLAHALQP
jgi:zinc/manganese transport system substrate-binding protein